ncbi:LicD family protein [Caproicibacter sp.]|uniref:LicD family protein n=1 Tax=Caproicibacter sp. TaxID=2814884 RepID=UPI003988AC51
MIKNFLKKYLPPSSKTFQNAVLQLEDDIKQKTESQQALAITFHDPLQKVIDQNVEIQDQLNLIQKRSESGSAELLQLREQVQGQLTMLKDQISCTSSELARIREQVSELKNIRQSLTDEIGKSFGALNEKIDVLSLQKQMVFWYTYAVQRQTSLSEAQRSFYRSLPKAEGDLRIIQNMEVYLLKNFIRICNENGLNYWLQGGTLLGAIRHKGFIPWDDDMDISMPRADFDKLQLILSKSEQFAICDYYHLVNRYWFSRIPKFICVASNTDFFLDIFVQECVPCPPEDEQAFWQHVCRMREELSDTLEALLPELTQPYSDVPIKNSDDKKKVDSVFNEFIQKTNAWSGCKGDSLVYYWSVPYVKFSWQRIYRQDVIFPLKTQNFEGEICCVPKHYEAYARDEYGDYLRLSNDFGLHGHWDVFSFGNQIEKASKFLTSVSETNKNFEGR